MKNFNGLSQKKSICVSCDKEKQTHNICIDCIIKTTQNESNEDYSEKLAEDFIKELQVASASINRAIKLGFVEGYNKAKAQHEVELSVRELHNYKLGLEDGYNKAKETYNYKKQDIINAIQYGIDLESGNIKFDYKKYPDSFTQYLDSLQQPKL